MAREDDDRGEGGGGGAIEFQFEKAERKGIKALVMFYGESGSGKTYSAQRFANGLDPDGKIGLLDTESGRGRHYANTFDFYYAELEAPYSPKRYMKAVADAIAQGVTTLIIDSLSHVHEGLGGLIDMAEASSIDSYAKWAKPKREWKKCRDYLLRCGINLIFCCRAKDPLEPSEDDKRKMVRGEIIPIVPRGFAYEVTVSVGLDATDQHLIHKKVSNELVAAFPVDQYISESAGAMMRQWLDGEKLVDKAYEAVKEAGKEQARKGMDALKVWWESLSEKLRIRLKDADYLDEVLKPIARGEKPAAAEKPQERKPEPPPPAKAKAREPEPPKQAPKDAPAKPAPAAAKKAAPAPEPEPDEDDDLELDLDERTGPQTEEAGEAEEVEEEEEEEPYPPIELGDKPAWSEIGAQLCDLIESKPTEVDEITRFYGPALHRMKEESLRNWRMVDAVIKGG